MESEASNEPQAQPVKYREVRFEHTPNLPQILDHVGITLLVSTYQAGKVLVLGTHQGKLQISFMHFDRAMGVAADHERIAVGTRRHIHFLQAAPEIAPRVDPAGTHDACFAMRSSFYSGNILGHDLAWGRDGLWVVNTLFSTLCTLHDGFNFVPHWRPRFVTELADQDRCHLNGLALDQGVPRFVTALAETNVAGGWRPTKGTTGCVIDVPSQEVVLRGLAMPHSPRMHEGNLWVLDSGNGDFGRVDLAAAKFQSVERLPGYTRGLAFAGQFAFVGLSKIRETAVFGGLPISERQGELRCGIGVIDLIPGKTVAVFQFHSGVDEIFAVEVLHGTRNPAVFGPASEHDEEHREVWIVPVPGESVRSNEPKIPIYARPPLNGPKPFVAAKAMSADQLAAQGVASHRQGRLAEAASQLESAITMSPSAAAMVNLGNVRQDQGDQSGAMAWYRRAIQHDPDCVPARQNLGYLLMNHGDPDQALEQYDQLLRLAPTPMNRLLHALALPVVYDSLEDVERWRDRIETKLTAMVADGIVVDTSDSLVPTTFFLAYQGKNDRHVMELLGKVLKGKSLNERQMAGESGRSDRRKIRVGFLSAYFRDHTIGRLNLGRIQRLDRARFEVIVFATSRQMDPLVEQFKEAADRWVSLPREVAESRALIAAEKLDLLLFADVGMDALASTLAYSRMAPVQCATWGHPDTTGSPSMDYFLSSELLETPQGEEHFSEKLVRMPLLGIHYDRPFRTGPVRTRAHFGLPPKQHLYVCPQTLFKFHPDFDEVLGGILAADPLGHIVVIEGRVAQWTAQLKRRWERTLGSRMARIKWLPPQPRDEFLALFQCADVSLDPLHFGGGNTTYEALAMGTPVVSLPGPYLRSRITAALYRKMGDTTCIVDSPQSYIELAVRLGCDAAFRNAVKRQILERVGVLFDDDREVRALENALAGLAVPCG